MNASAVLLPGFVGTELPPWLAVRLRGGLAGVCLFAENIESPGQLRALTAAIREANPHALIAIDEEGGDVSRLHAATGSPFPGNAVLGRIDDLAVTASVAAAVAGELLSAGINLNFAPDIDINSNPNNPVIGVRSFGSDPGLVARHGAAWIAAHEAQGVAVSAKHFPGHGDTVSDSHLALPVIDLSPAALQERELVPFRAAIQAGARTVMSSHILLPQLDPTAPATFSTRILGGLLREELGFEGVVVSDALDMVGASGEIGIPSAAVRALVGGCDLLCIGTRNTEDQLVAIEDAVLAALADGTLAAERLDNAVSRVRALAATLGIATVGIATGAAPAPFALDPTVLTGAFAVREGVLPLPAQTRLCVFGTSANVAVGEIPWGLGSVGINGEVLREGDALPESDVPYLLVGKDNHRHAWVRALIDSARVAQSATVVVDMGWPSPDRRYADLATFGASRAVSLALRGLLGEGIR